MATRHEKTGITFGGLVKGAAIVTGVVLMAAGIATDVTSIGSWLPEALQNIASGISVLGGTVTAMAGAVLAGGALLLGGSKDKGHHHHGPSPLERASWAERFAIEEMQAQMLTRAAVAGNPQAQQILSQQLSR